MLYFEFPSRTASRRALCLEKQIAQINEELNDVLGGLQKFSHVEQLTEEETRMLARIGYRMHRPCTTDDWEFLYKAHRYVRCHQGQGSGQYGHLLHDLFFPV